MVRQATDTAVSASISTPVWPVTFTRAVILMPGNLASGSASTSIWEMASGWHSGISSCVRLPAMMPAMRAAPSTSPFFASPLRTISSVSRCMITLPSATATLSVVALPDTSTMRASPLPLRWLSFFARPATALPGGRKRGLAREEGVGRGSYIVLAHQAFADEEGRNAAVRKPRQIVRREYAALADDDAARRNKPRQTLAGGERGRESFQIAIIDADKLRLQAQRAFQFTLIVHFDKRIHAERHRRRFKLAGAGVFDRGHDDEDAIGAVSACFRHLVGVVHEILAQHRQRHRRARLA